MAKKTKGRKFLRLLAFFVIWLSIIYIGGSFFADVVNERQPEITEGVDLVGEGLSDAERTPEQRANAEKQRKMNIETTAHDLGAITKALGISSWNVVGAEDRDGVPFLVPHFPKGQNFTAWHEAFVARIYANVHISDSAPFAYEIYNDWITMQLPDMKLKGVETERGIAFAGYSKSGKVFVSGKVLTGTLDSTVMILQYTVKNDGQPDVEAKAERWQKMLEAMK